jgi:hypothetical protein
MMMMLISTRRRYQDDEGKKRPDMSLLDLPTDLHVLLLSYLDFPSLQMLRATCSYFHQLPSNLQIAAARDAYRQTLFEQEQLDPNDKQLLTCYTCFRRLPISHFACTQISRRRSPGHIDAHKRFCASCAIRDQRWEPGTILSFPPHQRRSLVYCRRCRQVQLPPQNEWLWVFGLCETCRQRTGVPDAHPAKEGVPALVWRETKMLLDRLYTRHGYARVPIPESEWEMLEHELAMMRVDQELLDSTG